MRDMNPTQHPMEHPDFNAETNEPVWYLSHPLAADEKMTFQENVEHCKKIMRMCFDAGLRVVAPYLTIIEVLDDNNPEHRRIGLETDCVVANKLGRIILSGHRLSRGMECELNAVNRCVASYCEQHGYGLDIKNILDDNVVIDITEMDDDSAAEVLLSYRSRLA